MNDATGRPSGDVLARLRDSDAIRLTPLRSSDGTWHNR